MISANEINALLEDYLKSSDGQDFLKKQGISISFYDESQLIHIANNIKNDIRERLGKYFYVETECKPMIIAVIQEI